MENGQILAYSNIKHGDLTMNHVELNMNNMKTEDMGMYWTVQTSNIIFSADIGMRTYKEYKIEPSKGHNQQQFCLSDLRFSFKVKFKVYLSRSRIFVRKTSCKKGKPEDKTWSSQQSGKSQQK